MSARSTFLHLAAKAGILFGALFLVSVLLAAIPGLIKFDPLYWWAGRLWGERFIMTMPGSRRVTKHMDRAQRAGRSGPGGEACKDADRGGGRAAGLLLCAVVSGEPGVVLIQGGPLGGDAIEFRLDGG